MKITYIYHSCFTVEVNDIVFIFDYYKKDLPKFDITKKIFVFSSHKHQDHFNQEIFQKMEGYDNVRFILSKDIKMNETYMEKINLPVKFRNKIQYAGKNETIDMGEGILIETLTSTDEGVAFLIYINDLCIYHAGDLNWWTWIGESEEEYKDMTFRYQREIGKLKNKKIDVAFLPLDGRQEERFYLGFDYFMRNTNTLHAFPMHFWEDTSVITKLKAMDCAKEYKDNIIEVATEGQSFLI